MPDKARKKDPFAAGIVVAVGPGLMTESAKRVPVLIPVGAHVIFINNRAVEIILDGEIFLIMNASDVAIYKVV